MDRLNLPFHRLFILGAGFSRPAGLPLAEGLMQTVRQDLKGPFQLPADSPLEKEIKEWTELYPGKPLDLEHVLAYSLHKHYLRLMGSEETFEHGSQSIVDVRKAIQHALARATPCVTPPLYKELAASLTPYDVVLTFNYDTLWEQSLDDIDKPYSLTPEWWLKERSSGLDSKYVDVLKLHGSIDWYDRHYYDDAMRHYCRQGHEVTGRDPIFGPNPSIPSVSLAHGPIGELGNQIVSRVYRVPNVSTYLPIEERPVSRVVPFILPPAYDKLLGSEPIVDLWWSLHHNYDVFSSITIIGYSFPSQDSYADEALVHLLARYQRGGRNNRWKQRRVPIQLITKAESVECALKTVPFLDPDKTNIWRHGFSLESLNWIDWGDGAK